jgi:hypothetical protein
MYGKSPAYDGRWVPGRKGSKIATGDQIPESSRKTITKNYSNTTNEINPTIAEETSRIHTLGNENYIRDAVISLNNMTHSQIGQYEGLTKQSLSERGTKTSTDLASLKLTSNNTDLQELFTADNGVKKFSQLSNNSSDKNGNTSLLSKPYQTSAILDNSSNILTFNVDSNYSLKSDETVKYEDYEEINEVLDRISICLNRRNKWFDSNGRCQLTCQVNCQHTCQISCQGCNTKQCHHQHCGSF